jgi:hypothetical protein
MGEVHRIWNEMHLGDTEYAWYIMEALAVWLERSGSIYEVDGVDFVAWILPNGSRFVSKGPAFLRWFFCGLNVYNPETIPPPQQQAHVSPPLDSPDSADKDIQVMIDQLVL